MVWFGGGLERLIEWVMSIDIWHVRGGGMEKEKRERERGQQRRYLNSWEKRTAAMLADSSSFWHSLFVCYSKYDFEVRWCIERYHAKINSESYL